MSSGGHSAESISRSKNFVSRHRLQWCFLLAPPNSPGGKRLGVTLHFFGQQRDQELPIEPGTAGTRIELGQMPKSGQRLESLESQFDLPAHAIPFQNLRVAQQF